MLDFIGVDGLPVQINRSAILKVVEGEITDESNKPYAKIITPVGSVIVKDYVENVENLLRNT